LAAEVLDSLSVERREAGWSEILSSLPTGATVLVAVEGERIIGFAGVGPSRDDDATEATGELSSLYIEEDVACWCRSRADGLGDRVLRERWVPGTHTMGSGTELTRSAVLRSSRSPT
jgi:hypothetical protein